MSKPRTYGLNRESFAKSYTSIDSQKIFNSSLSSIHIDLPIRFQLVLEFIVNMALRVRNELSFLTIQTSSLYHLVGLPVLWHESSAKTLSWIGQVAGSFSSSHVGEFFHLNYGADESNRSTETQGSYIAGGS